MRGRAEVPASVTISAVITRADGTVEHVGVVSADHHNPFRRLWWNQIGRRQADRRIRQANKKANP